MLVSSSLLLFGRAGAEGAGYGTGALGSRGLRLPAL